MARADDARQLRKDVADEEFNRSQGVTHPTNGEEQDYNGTFIGNYSKGLPHNSKGEVDQSAYNIFLTAANSQNANGFQNIPPGYVPQAGDKRPYFKLINPISGLTFDIEGADSQGLMIPAAPRIDASQGDAGAAEIAEVYWMALCRDVPFVDFGSNNLIQEAATSLTGEFSTYPSWPKDASNNLTSATVFRGNFKGDNVGPFVSQFLLKGNKDEVLGRDERDGYCKYGAASYDNRIAVGLKDKDYMTHFDSWLAVENGEDRSLSLIEAGDERQLKDYYDKTPRFIHNMRGLASYVHFDKLYQAYLNALIYLSRLPNKESKVDGQTLLDPGHPYSNPPLNKNQSAFGTFGAPHILSLVTEVASRALKCAWYQKWFVHRRLRPEAFAGLIHVHKVGQANYPINPKILNSSVLDKIAQRNKDLNQKYNRHDQNPAPGGKYYLLPQAFPEGSPTHPSYPAGHATVAGACVTILKAWFNEDYPIKNPVHAVDDGKKLDHYNGPGKNDLTLGGELNKLAANIAIGRNMGGVHYRSDYIESVKLGEMLAIDILQDQRNTYFENYTLTLKKEYRFVDTTQDVKIAHP